MYELAMRAYGSQTGTSGPATRIQEPRNAVRKQEPKEAAITQPITVVKPTGVYTLSPDWRNERDVRYVLENRSSEDAGLVVRLRHKHEGHPRLTLYLQSKRGLSEVDWMDRIHRVNVPQETAKAIIGRKPTSERQTIDGMLQSVDILLPSMNARAKSLEEKMKSMQPDVLRYGGLHGALVSENINVLRKELTRLKKHTGQLEEFSSPFREKQAKRQ